MALNLLTARFEVMGKIPIPRFEDEYPEEAARLMQISAWADYRKLLHWILKFDGSVSVRKNVPYEHRAKEPGRNQPCGCGSKMKFKECCQLYLRWFAPTQPWAEERAEVMQLMVATPETDAERVQRERFIQTLNSASL